MASKLTPEALAAKAIAGQSVKDVLIAYAFASVSEKVLLWDALCERTIATRARFAKHAAKAGRALMKTGPRKPRSAAQLANDARLGAAAKARVAPKAPRRAVRVA